jgi:hypothetical protein
VKRLPTGEKERYNDWILIIARSLQGSGPKYEPGIFKWTR